jgi:hypothetical protein
MAIMRKDAKVLAYGERTHTHTHTHTHDTYV